LIVNSTLFISFFSHCKISIPCSDSRGMNI
jgi:hypothetical protein